jgi:hypothetical protein
MNYAYFIKFLCEYEAPLVPAARYTALHGAKK